MNRVEVNEQGQDRVDLHDRQKEKECELQCPQTIPGISDHWQELHVRIPDKGQSQTRAIFLESEMS